MDGKIYVTGASGEDLFTRSDKGGRQTTHSAEDKAYDFLVPRGAPFVECVLQQLVLDKEVPDKAPPEQAPSNHKSSHKIEALRGMLTHIKKYGDKYRVWHMDWLIKYESRKQDCISWNENDTLDWADLLVIHYGDAAWGNKTFDKVQPHLEKFLKNIKQSSKNNNKPSHVVPPILVNAKELPELSLCKGTWQFEAPLWQMLSLPEYRSEVGIVVAMSTLRRKGAAISLGFSWERTIEDFAAELHLFPQLNVISQFFPHLYVRVGVAGLIHIEKDETGSSRRGTLYFISNTLEAFHRDPEVEGRVIGKNTLLIASLARARRRREANLRPAFANAICALRKFHDEGYSRDILEAIGPTIEQGTTDKYRTGIKFIRKSFEGIKKQFFSATDPDPKKATKGLEVHCSDIAIPQYLMDQLLPDTLRSAKRWHMLNDALHNAPVHRVNIALAIVMVGHKRILNSPLSEKALGEDVWKVLNRADYWNPYDRAPDYMTLVEGEHPSIPITDRHDLPIIPEKIRNEEFELKAPVLEFGKTLKLVVAEREEFEGLCSVSRLLNSYVREKEHDRKPISIAVFGPPGTGKSFAIKRIAESFDPSEKVEILEFNVAQFKGIVDLGVVLTRVGSLNHQGKTPLVFFDEFDCVLDKQPLGWLKYFLAPMQDASFYDANQTIEIGRAIFVFAGGTYPSFELFDPRTIAVPSEEEGLEVSREHKDRVKAFAERKGPDFISRLRGHINISQINNESGHVKHLIRRALVLRSMVVAQHFCHPGNDEEGEAMIDEEVIYALLTVDRYRHGVRSMEAILQMSKPIDGRIHIASLPSPAQLNMHVDAEEFLIRLYRGRNRPNVPATGSVPAKQSNA